MAECDGDDFNGGGFNGGGYDNVDTPGSSSFNLGGGFNDARTRDFLAPAYWCTGSESGLFPDAPGSTSVNTPPARVGVAAPQRRVGVAVSAGLRGLHLGRQ
jgi:hypothetical protein